MNPLCIYHGFCADGFTAAWVVWTFYGDGQDVPRTYGSPATCWRRFRTWAADGTWEQIWRTLLSQLDAQGKLEWAQAFLDGSFVPAKKRGTGIGKTKVGKGSKVMVVADGQGLPLGLYIASARHHESWWMPPWPRCACRRDTAVHELARRRGIKPTIPTFERRKRRQPKRGRPIKTGANDRQRWKVERCFGWMDNCRLCSAIISLPRSRRLRCQPVFVVQTTKDGMGHYPQMGRKPVPVVLPQNRQARGRLRNAWPQGHMRTPLIVMSYPCLQDVSQVVRRERNHKI
jgi:hypothetical protein